MALKYKLSLCGFFTVVLTAVLPLYITFLHQKTSLETHLQEKLQAMVASSSQFIDSDLHNIIRKTTNQDDFAQDEFDEISSILSTVKKQNNLKSAVYTMRPYNKENLEFVVMTDKNKDGKFFTGNLYKKEAFHDDVLKGKIAGSPVYTDSEGSWISAAAPIFDSENKVTALLQADFEISHYYDELYSHIFKLAKIILIAVIFCFIFFMVMINKISRPLNQLTDATIQISKGNWDQDIKVQTKDEIGTLAANFSIMKEAVLRQQDELKARETEALTAKEQALKARDEAEEASKAKSEFLAVMSHEIRTPMNGVIASAELLNETPLDDKQKDYLYTLRQSADLQLRVINDILDFSKLDSKNMTLEDVTFDLHKLIQNISEVQKISARQKGLELSCSIDANVPLYIQADPIRIRQMVLNISNNSLKFTHEGSITINVSYESGLLKICISDTGIGVAEEKILGIFDPFSQADNSTSRKYGGTGLGLSICKKIAALMNGEIDMTSTPGVGTSVTISFPVSTSDRSELHETQFNMIIPIPGFEEKEPDKEYKAPEYKVLLVEDNILNQKVAVELLRPYNVEIIMAENGVQALEKLKSENINLVLMDCMMPVMDGYEATEIIRREKIIKDEIPIIALTANSSEADIEKCKNIGMDDFIAKPATRKKFQTIMDKWLPEKSQEKTEEHDGLIILLVEDNKTNLLLAEKLLSKYSKNVLIAENGLEAVDILKTNHADIIFMDCMMPLMDGYDATREIRAQKLVDEDTPIVALTANTSLEDRLKCKDSGMNDIIPKPATREKLDKAFEKWVFSPIQNKGKKRILLVDDNDINQMITAKLLEKYSNNIKFANDGFEAVKKVKEEKFDIILMDCMMPNKNGFEASIEIRTHCLVSEGTPIIALTAHSNEEVKEQCLKSGMNDIISKPVTRNSLDTVLIKWLS